MMKGLNIGLGYWMSANKFSTVAGVLIDEAKRLHSIFWGHNKLLRAVGRKVERAFKATAGKGDFELEIPGGRSLTYRAVSNVGGSMSAVTCRNGKMMRAKVWIGLLIENSCQATARMVLAEKLLNLEAEGLMPILHVHDEAICLVPEESAEKDLNRMIEIMSETPEWMPGLPLAAEGVISDCYTK